MHTCKLEILNTEPFPNSCIRALHISSFRRLNPGGTPFLFLLWLSDEVVLANRIGDSNASGAWTGLRVRCAAHCGEGLSTCAKPANAMWIEPLSLLQYNFFLSCRNKRQLGYTISMTTLSAVLPNMSCIWHFRCADGVLAAALSS